MPSGTRLRINGKLSFRPRRLVVTFDNQTVRYRVEVLIGDNRAICVGAGDGGLTTFRIAPRLRVEGELVELTVCKSGNLYLLRISIVAETVAQDLTDLSSYAGTIRIMSTLHSTGESPPRAGGTRFSFEENTVHGLVGSPDVDRAGISERTRDSAIGITGKVVLLPTQVG